MVSWEVQNNRRVLCAFLHTENVSVAWSLGFRNLIIPGAIMPIAGMPFDMARNKACEETIKGGFDYLFQIDSDVIAPRDTILRLMSHNKPLISGVYHRRSVPHGVPVMMKPLGQWVTKYPANSVIEVDVVGAGCLLIHRDLLIALAQNPPQDRPEKPWFNWQVDRQGHVPQDQCLSEDFVLCKRVKQLFNIPTLVDTSVQCKHVGMAEFTYMNSHPLIIETNT